MASPVETLAGPGETPPPHPADPCRRRASELREWTEAAVAFILAANGYCAPL